MIDDIGKQAVTLHVFIDKMQHNIEYSEFDIPHSQIKLVQKAVNKFLNNMEQTEYYFLSDKWGRTYHDYIQSHVDDLKELEDNTATYLTWIQFQIHSFIRDVFPSHLGDSFHRVRGYRNFYKRTLETLLR